MSSPFNYELDERQIRILLQNAELEYDASAWEQFNATTSIAEYAVKTAPKTAGFGFGISRQVLVPAFFILVIGGLSALLFSFVNFKKNDTAEPERLLENNTASFVVDENANKPTQAQSAVVVKPAALKTDSIKTPIVHATETHTTAAVVTPPVNKPAATTAVTVKQEPVKTVIKQEERTYRRKRRKHEAVEELPSINASSSFNATSNEPEPELKVN